MPATPAWIGEFTVDGVVLSRVDTAIRAADPAAVDLGDREIEMFFDFAADGDIVLDERWNLQKQRGRFHEAVEFEIGALPLGTFVALTPALPTINVTDRARSISVVPRTRAYVNDYQTERSSIELLA
jgi:hypothetical protein